MMEDSAKSPNGTVSSKIKSILYEEITAVLGKSTGGNITIDYGYAVQRITSMIKDGAKK